VAACSTGPDGTDVPALESAAAEFGFKLGRRHLTTPWLAKAAIGNYITEQVPILVCVDCWYHWVTIVASDARGIMVCDGERDGGDVLRALTWREALSRMVRWYPPKEPAGTDEKQFHLYPLVRV